MDLEVAREILYESPSQHLSEGETSCKSVLHFANHLSNFSCQHSLQRANSAVCSLSPLTSKQCWMESIKRGVYGSGPKVQLNGPKRGEEQEGVLWHESKGPTKWTQRGENRLQTTHKRGWGVRNDNLIIISILDTTTRPHKSRNKGWTSADRSTKATLMLTVPRPI